MLFSLWCVCSLSRNVKICDSGLVSSFYPLLRVQIVGSDVFQEFTGKDPKIIMLGLGY